MRNYVSNPAPDFQVKDLQFNSPDVFDKDTPESRKKVFWSLVQLWKEGSSRTGKAEIEFKVAELAEKTGLSPRTVQRRLRELEDNLKLIERYSYNGQGRGVRVKILWIKYRLDREKSKRWARKFQKEDQFLKSSYPPAVGSHQFGTPPLANMGNSNKDFNTSERSQEKSKSQKNQLGPKGIFYRDIPTETEIESETGLFRLVMGNIRYLLKGKDRITEVILTQLGSWLPGRTVGEVRKLVSALKDWISRIKDRLSWIFENREKPVQVAHSVVRYFLNNLRLKPKKERLDGQELDRRKRKAKRKARKEFDQIAREGESSELSAREKIEKVLSPGSGIMEDPEVSKARKGFQNFKESLSLSSVKARGSIRQGVKREGPEKMLKNLINQAEKC